MEKINENNPNNDKFSLADLSDGDTGTVVKILSGSRGEKKFTDMGIVAGTEMAMLSRAPFGGLLRIKFLGTRIALHSTDAKNIILKKLDDAHERKIF